MIIRKLKFNTKIGTQVTYSTSLLQIFTLITNYNIYANAVLIPAEFA